MGEDDIKVYFDTEFTGLQKDTDLISIAMIVNDSIMDIKQSLYIEFNDYDQSKVNDWVKQNVISNLTLKGDGIAFPSNHKFVARCNKAEAKTHIFNWLKDIYEKPEVGDSKIQLVGDVCHYDFVLFLDLFGSALDLPAFISPTCEDINGKISDFFGITSSHAFDYSREGLLSILKNWLKLYGDDEVEKDDTFDFYPPVMKDNKHNALHDAYVISKIDTYLEKAILMSVKF